MNETINAAEEQTDQDAVLSLCKDCNFVEAVAVDDYEDAAGTADDPAYEHYKETGHNCGSFEPRKQLAEQWGLLFTGYDGPALRSTTDLWELAAGKNTEEN